MVCRCQNVCVNVQRRLKRSRRRAEFPTQPSHVCQSVLGRDIEPLTGYAELVSALHGSSATSCVWIDVNRLFSCVFFKIKLSTFLNIIRTFAITGCRKCGENTSLVYSNQKSDVFWGIMAALLCLLVELAFLLGSICFPDSCSSLSLRCCFRCPVWATSPSSKVSTSSPSHHVSPVCLTFHLLLRVLWIGLCRAVSPWLGLPSGTSRSEGEARANARGFNAGPANLPPLSSRPPQQIETPAGRHGARYGPMLGAHMPQAQIPTRTHRHTHGDWCAWIRRMLIQTQT